MRHGEIVLPPSFGRQVQWPTVCFRTLTQMGGNEVTFLSFAKRASDLILMSECNGYDRLFVRSAIFLSRTTHVGDSLAQHGNRAFTTTLISFCR